MRMLSPSILRGETFISCSNLVCTPECITIAFFVYKPVQTIAKTGVFLEVWSRNLI